MFLIETRENFLNFIENLGKKVRLLERKYKADQGGCLWISYCISKRLEEMGQSYKVVIYTDNTSNTTDIETILKDEELQHMIISIVDNEIGTSISEKNMKEHNIRKFTTEMSSDEILKLYEEYDYSPIYDKQNNEKVKRGIDVIFDNYLKHKI